LARSKNLLGLVNGQSIKISHSKSAAVGTTLTETKLCTYVNLLLCISELHCDIVLIVGAKKVFKKIMKIFCCISHQVAVFQNNIFVCLI